MTELVARRPGRTSVLMALALSCVVVGALVAVAVEPDGWAVAGLGIASVVGVLLVELRHVPFLGLIVVVVVEGVALIGVGSEPPAGPAHGIAIALALLPLAAAYHLGRSREWSPVLGITVLAWLVLVVLSVGAATQQVVAIGWAEGDTTTSGQAMRLEAAPSTSTQWAWTSLAWALVTVVPAMVGELVQRRGRAR